jgi:hypothetical protein
MIPLIYILLIKLIFYYNKLKSLSFTINKIIYITVIINLFIIVIN